MKMHNNGDKRPLKFWSHDLGLKSSVSANGVRSNLAELCHVTSCKAGIMIDVRTHFIWTRTVKFLKTKTEKN